VKKLYLLLFSLFLFLGSAQAGWSLEFCQRDSSGFCLGQSDLFFWNGDKTQVILMLRNKAGMTIPKMEIKIFEMASAQNGEIYADLHVYARSEWKQVSKRIYFVKPGYYKVEIYDEKMNRLAENFLTISDREN